MSATLSVALSLRSAITTSGFCQASRVAALTELAPRHVQDLERARRAPSLATLVELANALELPVARLLRSATMPEPRAGQPPKRSRKRMR
jgi:transcriptional regulator with XRE-family HTH domain